MIFATTRLEGVRLIHLEANHDERGFFARTWCCEEMAEAGLETTIAQESLSHTKAKGTVRGLHFQRPPFEEVKIVRCAYGAIFDVVVDLRPRSPSYLRWEGFELSAENKVAVYVPRGFAHGFQTLVDGTDVLYQISSPYVPGASAGYRYDDPSFGVAWPLAVAVISGRDLSWPPYAAAADQGG